MKQETEEYRYGSAARKRAALWCVASCLLALTWGTVLASNWGMLGAAARIGGLGGMLLLLLTLRSQLNRILFRCVIDPHNLQIVAPFGKRSVAWETIAEVRQMRLRQITGQRWACVLFTQSARGPSAPQYVFDDQLEGSGAALRSIVAHTPHAQHNLL